MSTPTGWLRPTMATMIAVNPKPAAAPDATRVCTPASWTNPATPARAPPRVSSNNGSRPARTSLVVVAVSLPPWARIRKPSRVEETSHAATGDDDEHEQDADVDVDPPDLWQGGVADDPALRQVRLGVLQRVAHRPRRQRLGDEHEQQRGDHDVDPVAHVEPAGQGAPQPAARRRRAAARAGSARRREGR